MVTGAFCIAGSLWFTFELPKMRAVMRPIYESMGLLPGRGSVYEAVHESVSVPAQVTELTSAVQGPAQ